MLDDLGLCSTCWHPLHVSFYVLTTIISSPSSELEKFQLP
jgi:hypothetical protein